MSKVSKNIKKLRTDRNMTQDSLAERICVTRQTVSSWENGRTQPDIDMLEHLADALNAGIEEIIYGEKRNIGFEAPKNDKQKIMSIVFATLGSLLTATGLIIIFVSLWDRIPEFLLASLSFLPLIAGGGVALWVYEKKRSSIGWSEGASVAWVAGLIATTALVISMFSIDIDIWIIMAFISILILPIAYIFNAVFPLTAYFCTVTYYVICYPLSSFKNFIPLAFGIVLYILGLIRIKSTDSSDARQKFSVWVALISAGVMLYFHCLESAHRGTPSLLCLLFGTFAALYAADKGDDFPYPFRYIAVPSITVALSLLCFSAESWIGRPHYGTLTPNLLSPGLSPIVAAISLVSGIIYGKKSFIKNHTKTVFVALSSIASFICAISATFAEFFSETTETVVVTAIILISFAVSVTLIVDGIRKIRLSTVNLGLVMICVIVYATLIMGRFDAVYSGIACIAMGLILLFINFKLSKVFKAKEMYKNA